MAWYHWIATYLLIIAAFAFWIIPDKNLFFVGTCIVVGLIALAMMRFLPPKEDEKEYKPIPWPEPVRKVGRMFGTTIGIVLIVSFALLMAFGLYMDIFN